MARRHTPVSTTTSNTGKRQFGEVQGRRTPVGKAASFAIAAYANSAGRLSTKGKAGSFAYGVIARERCASQAKNSDFRA
jgi:hypothetical protein